MTNQEGGALGEDLTEKVLKNVKLGVALGVKRATNIKKACRSKTYRLYMGWMMGMKGIQ